MAIERKKRERKGFRNSVTPWLPTGRNKMALLSHE